MSTCSSGVVRRSAGADFGAARNCFGGCAFRGMGADNGDCIAESKMDKSEARGRGADITCGGRRYWGILFDYAASITEWHKTLKRQGIDR